MEIENQIISHLMWTNSSPEQGIHNFSPSGFDLTCSKIKDLLVEEFETRSFFPNDCSSQNLASAKPKLSSEEFALIVVYRKLLRYAKNRVCEIISRVLSFPIAAGDFCTSVLRYALIHRAELLVNNHVDVLILCSLYSICRIAKLDEIKFQTLILGYLDLYPSNKIVINLPHFENVHIIQYYNTHFLPSTKSYIMSQIKPLLSELSVQQALSEPRSHPRMNQNPETHQNPETPTKKKRRLALSLSPRYPVDSALNIFLSHLKPIHRPPLPNSTPSSSALETSSGTPVYAFGESPARTLHLINERLTEPSKTQHS